MHFKTSQAAVGGVVTATQVGSALALLLLVPLGDIVERRRLLLVQLLALMIALSAVALAQSAVVLLTGMLATGLLGTAMTQGLIASVASIASEQERGRVVGAMATTVIYARFGWQGVCLLGASVSLLALIVWSTTRRWMRLNNTP
ncbi:MFS transporter [Kosakonia sp. MUSA4]|uniref:MFS transporter n=1 Tax=Kosakonia sp. MUSA4 TaxID=2067958 RepID=UPI00352FFCB7